MDLADHGRGRGRKDGGVGHAPLSIGLVLSAALIAGSVAADARDSRRSNLGARDLVSAVEGETDERRPRAAGRKA